MLYGSKGESDNVDRVDRFGEITHLVLSPVVEQEVNGDEEKKRNDDGLSLFNSQRLQVPASEETQVDTRARWNSV